MKLSLLTLSQPLPRPVLSLLLAALARRHFCPHFVHAHCIYAGGSHWHLPFCSCSSLCLEVAQPLYACPAHLWVHLRLTVDFPSCFRFLECLAWSQKKHPVIVLTRKPVMVAHACSANILEPKARGSQGPGQPRLMIPVPHPNKQNQTSSHHH